MALGGDEALDLTREQREKAEQIKQANNDLSRADIYRSMRPSTHGLLLIYPIIPATPKAAELRGNPDKAYLWAGNNPVIGIAVSLPGSKHDHGCDYVCTPQKIREIFGEESAVDLERDEQEAEEPL